jgi:hypothetical protein
MSTPYGGGDGYFLSDSFFSASSTSGPAGATTIKNAAAHRMNTMPQPQTTLTFA